jgi:hypothetical protein
MKVQFFFETSSINLTKEVNDWLANNKVAIIKILPVTVCAGPHRNSLYTGLYYEEDPKTLFQEINKT